MNLRDSNRARAREASIFWLVGAVFLAAIGILLSAPPALMIAGAAAALVLWDFAGAPRKSYLRARFPFALASADLGAAIAVAGAALRLALPFFAMLLCALACAFCIDRFARAALSRKSRGQ